MTSLDWISLDCALVSSLQPTAAKSASARASDRVRFMFSSASLQSSFRTTYRAPPPGCQVLGISRRALARAGNEPVARGGLQAMGWASVYWGGEPKARH